MSLDFTSFYFVQPPQHETGNLTLSHQGPTHFLDFLKLQPIFIFATLKTKKPSGTYAQTYTGKDLALFRSMHAPLGMHAKVIILTALKLVLRE